MAQLLASTPLPAHDIAAIEAEHALWLDSEGREGKRAHFRGADLIGLNLSGRQLAEASFRGALLRGVNCSGADLRGCDMAEAVIEDVDFSFAVMAGAMLTRARMERVEARGANLAGANMMGLETREANFAGAELQQANLREAQLAGANLSGATLRGANMRGANLTGATLSGADVSEAECRDADLSRSVFTGAKVEGTNFRGALLDEADLTGADFSQAFEVGEGYKTQLLQSERHKLHEGQEAVQRLKLELQLREEILEKERDRLRAFEVRLMRWQDWQQLLEDKMHWLAWGFAARFLLWAVAMSVVVSYAWLHWPEGAQDKAQMLTAGAISIMLLAFFSTLRAFQVWELLSRKRNRK